MTHGGSSLREVQELVAVLAVGKRVGEAGTAFGEGAAAMAATARSVVTVECDPERAAIAEDRLRSLANVELLVGEWQEHLPPRAPFELLSMTPATSSGRRSRAASSSSASSRRAACSSSTT
jgi:protein-L-isoaspartate O-methyltransferase